MSFIHMAFWSVIFTELPKWLRKSFIIAAKQNTCFGVRKIINFLLIFCCVCMEKQVLLNLIGEEKTLPILSSPTKAL